MKNYRHLFFDLDLTLWDFEKNSSETLQELHAELCVQGKYNIASHDFISAYQYYNDILWDQYRLGIITKEGLRVQRFQQALMHFGIEDNLLATEMGDGYIARSPMKTHLFPYTIEILEYLNSKYTLHIITNGFHEVQFIKLDNSGLRKYFKNIITSESSGFKKPDKRIFHHSLYRAKAKSKQSIMIGDHLEVDIVGARNAGLDQIYFNPKKIAHKEMVTYEIDCLSRLKDIF
ncbi:MAG: noncanonical pyrimidine nucleotidase, YjjG family [Bacteroidetes bacterium]|nr:noncanonical pyrimidine nucleotidase, YjjG family [Bacteroidota bacterium]